MASGRILVAVTVWCSLLTLSTQGALALEPLALRTFALEDLIPLREELHHDRMTEKWISETEFISSEPGFSKRIYNAATDSSVVLLTEAELMNLNGRAVADISKDKTYLLLMGNRRKVFRFSSIADYAVYDLENKTIQKIGEGALQTVVLGPKGALAYVYKNNVYYVPYAKQPDIATALTDEGIQGQVYFGVTDWIYEEEVFNAAEALWFSPAGTYLAVASFNDTQVQSAIYPYYGNPFDTSNQYPHIVQFKYPKAGRTNPVASLRVYNPNDPTTPPKVIAAPVDLVGLDHILGRVNWASDTTLAVLWLNRRQNVSVLTNCDLLQDKCRIVKEQMELNGWIDISDPFFDSTGTKVVEIQPLYYKENRYMHIAQLDFNSMSMKDLTPDNSTVTELLGWNQPTDTVYYIVSPANLPWQRQLWATTGGVTRCVSCREPSCHTVSASFAPGAAYGLISCSAFNLPPSIFLYDTQKDTFKLIKNNADLKLTLSQYKLPMALFNSIAMENGIRANIRLLLPPIMESGQKYPMIVKVYAGPGSSTVKDAYEMDYNMYLTSNRSFIVATIDVRGSSVLGVEALHAVNNALGTVEVTDTLATIRHLVKTFSFIDPERVGVWGWSYGGFATTMMLILDTQRTLACGAAIAPVTSWLYYDSIYTERYMDTPQANPSGYQRAELTLQAARLRGRKLLLVHGSGDDNVHHQHSLQLAKQLQHEDIAFQQMTYTDESHSLSSVGRHFYHTLDHFWTDCFEHEP